MTIDEIRALFPPEAHVAGEPGTSVYVTIKVNTAIFRPHIGGDKWAREGILYPSLADARDAWYKELREAARAAYDTIRKLTYVPEERKQCEPPVLGKVVFVPLTDGQTGWTSAQRVTISWNHSKKQWDLRDPTGFALFRHNTPQEVVGSYLQSLQTTLLHHYKQVASARASIECIQKKKAALGLEVTPCS